MLITKTEIPPSGWNSFDCYLTTINEVQTLANLEQFLRKLKPAGYEYFCLDAAWYADGDAELDEDLRRVGQNRKMHIDEFGRFIPSPINFPHGLRPIADRCHENGEIGLAAAGKQILVEISAANDVVSGFEFCLHVGKQKLQLLVGNFSVRGVGG